jgi:hypothetical protein
MQKSEQTSESFAHTASGMWANGFGLTKNTSANILGVQLPD